MWHCSDCHSLRQISSRKTVNEIREANEGGCKSTDVYLQKKKKKIWYFYFSTFPIWNDILKWWFNLEMKVIINAIFLNLDLISKHRMATLRHIIMVAIYITVSDFYEVLQLWKLLIIKSSRSQVTMLIYANRPSSESRSVWHIVRLFQHLSND